MRALLLTSLLLFIVGCSVNHTPPTTAPAAQHAECLVCKHNADLACVDLEVDKDTPQLMYAGKTYYFCSDTCRDKFAKNPGKYVKP